MYWTVIQPIEKQKSKIITSTCVIEEQLSIKHGKGSYAITAEVAVYNYLVHGIEMKLTGSCTTKTCPGWEVNVT
jgi:hypothetical protein